MTKQLKLSALAAALLVSASAFAAKPGFVSDQATDSVVRNSYNECWKTGDNPGTNCDEKAVAPVKPGVAPQQPKVSVNTISLSAKVLFDFDKAKLRAGARAELDPIVDRLKGHVSGGALKGVEVVGHTDFMGSAAYNDRLSRERANSVRAFLVSAGLPAANITAIGRGAADARMTEECKRAFPNYTKKGSKQNLAIKACIEPDRRVDVRIEATEASDLKPSNK